MLALAGALALAGCGGSDGDGGSSPTAAPQLSQKQIRDLPPPLAENARQANEIIDGSVAALNEKLASLRGFPVVVNQWGSWCPPCRAEFPFFADSGRAHLDEVAFIGVDIQEDSREAAEAFLEDFPTPYPHIFDDDLSAVSSLGWGQVSPTTWLIDERGEIAHQRPGQYANREELERDIETFLLGG